MVAALPDRAFASSKYPCSHTLFVTNLLPACERFRAPIRNDPRLFRAMVYALLRRGISLGETASEKDFDYRITRSYAVRHFGFARAAGHDGRTAKRTRYRFQCVEFSSCAASPQAQQELASPDAASPHLKTAQPDAVELSVSVISFRTGILQNIRRTQNGEPGGSPFCCFLAVVCLAGVIQRDFRRRPAPHARCD